jgi:anti-anti-sigma factor
MNCTVRQAGNVAIIDWNGRIMGPAGSGAVRDAIRSELQQGHKNILLNLNAVDYIDSSGLGAMAESYITVAKLGGSLKLLNTQSRVSSMLQVTSLYTVLVTFSEESKALASFVP